ncbi:oligosaccharide flippase family protein [Acholeplasma laidlawii]|uniref:oligosaccharide flippase family protein n=1 Tax=Acholeplasma laidlawii TaxID=2148 RepID=UPI0018C32746|nr:oligosaccharide flippase family protein [Acholeplasma laidlawii]MBG0763192.1 oligosaccharide flippase family protein [Acholeplasma laidlawii]
MSKSITKNYLYNFLYQLLIIIIPVILIPYLSRILLPEGLGEYSYHYSIVTYFSYAAVLGVQLYATKLISEKRESAEETKQAFVEVFLIKAITSLISIAVFIAMYLTKLIPNTNLILIQSLVLIANLLDITWYFTGRENFKAIVVRNLLIRTTSFAMILIFVNKPQDIYIYAFIMIGTEILSQVIMWAGLIKEKVLFVKIEKITLLNIQKHFKGLVILFIPQLITLFYNNATITILGMVSTKTEVGYFDVAAKITNTLLVLITTLGLVVMPQISYLIANDENGKVNEILTKSVKAMLFLAYPITLGFFVLTPITIPWFLGEAYASAVWVCGIYSLKIIFIAVSNIIGIQYLIPKGNNGKYILSVAAGAIINLGLLFLTAPYIGALGAAIALVVAEFFVTTVQIFVTRKEINFINKIRSTYKSFISSVVMSITLFLIISFFPFESILSRFNSASEVFVVNGLINLGIVFIGGCIYLITNKILKNDIQKLIIEKGKDLFVRSRHK